MLTWTLVIAATAFARVYLQYPDTLRSQVYDKYNSYYVPASLAHFGDPPYGSLIHGRLYLTQPGEELACGPLTQLELDPTEEFGAPVLLVARGLCPYSLKVMNAERAGIRAVLIYNNEPGSIDNMIIIDSGDAGNVEVPSFLITKEEGEMFRKHLTEGDPLAVVRLLLSFEMNRVDNRVEASLWTSSFYEPFHSFLEEFSKVAQNFHPDEFVFTPHYILWYCSACQEQGYTVDDPDCVSGGKFCAPDPDGQKPGTGRDVVLEDLRQMCVHQQHPQKWWKYLREFYSTCSSKFSKACSDSASTEAGIDPYLVSQCVTRSFASSNFALADNSVLAKERELVLSLNIRFFPMLVINNQMYRGDLEVRPVMQALCAGFAEWPKACHKYFSDSGPVEEQDDIVVWVIVAILVAAIVVVIALIGYRVLMLKTVNRDVSSHVNQYIALSESRR